MSVNINSSNLCNNKVNQNVNNTLITKNPTFCAKPIEIKSEKTTKFIYHLGENFNSAQQRLVAGATAILTQPFIDINNKKVDEETRKTSCARTISKIVVGTTTGVLIREACIQAIKNLTIPTEDLEKLKISKKQAGKELKFENFRQSLLPKDLKSGLKTPQLKSYRNTLGTIFALGIMLFTNFLIDAPLTSKLTNKLTPLFSKDKENKEVK